MPRVFGADYYYNEETKLYACPCIDCDGLMQSKRTFDRHRRSEEEREKREAAQPHPLAQLGVANPPLGFNVPGIFAQQPQQQLPLNLPAGHHDGDYDIEVCALNVST